MSKNVGVTGHRKLFHPSELILKEFDKKLISIGFTKVITGMAIGFDQLVSEWCIKNNIPFIAAIPFKTQAKLWPQEQIKVYLDLLEKAEEIVVVSDGDYAPYKMHTRNEWIVSNSDVVVGYCFSDKGGTYSCLEYAKRKQKPIEKLSF